MKLVFCFLLALISQQTLAAGFYVGPGIGYTRFLNDRLKALDLVSAGPRLGVTAGYHFGQVAVETFFNSANTKTNEHKFNDQRYVFHAKMKSYGLVGKYFINIFHIHLGYAIHKFDFSVTSYPDGSMVHQQDVLDNFGASGKNTFNGPLFGFGADFPIGVVTPYFVITSYQMNGTNSDIMEIELGLKISF